MRDTRCRSQIIIVKQRAEIDRGELPSIQGLWYRFLSSDRLTIFFFEGRGIMRGDRDLLKYDFLLQTINYHDLTTMQLIRLNRQDKIRRFFLLT